MRKTISIIATILRNKVTYRFLAVVLASFGIASATDTAGRLEAILCAILGGCS